MCLGFHVKHTLLLSDFNESRIFSTDFLKNSNIKFHENLSSGSRVVPCRQTDMTKLIVTFHNFANAPKNEYIKWIRYQGPRTYHYRN